MSQYTALDENFRFDWTLNEIKSFESMWNDGIPVDTIASVLERDPDEVVILVIDRARKRKIKPRKEGLIVKR